MYDDYCVGGRYISDNFDNPLPLVPYLKANDGKKLGDWVKDCFAEVWFADKQNGIVKRVLVMREDVGTLESIVQKVMLEYPNALEVQ
jgi:hypothetical protein